MLKNIHIKKFKCLEDENLELGGLTILAGKNSSGKSTVLQSILIAARNCNLKNKERMYGTVSKYQALDFDFELSNDTTHYTCSNDNFSAMDDETLLFEESLYYLSSNRFGQEELAKFSKEYKVGENGEFLLGTYFLMLGSSTNFHITFEDCKYFFDLCTNKNIIQDITDSMLKTIHVVLKDNKYKPHEKLKNLCKIVYDKEARENCPDEMKTLLLHLMTFPVALNCWLSYITESKNSFLAEVVTSDRCKTFFHQKEIGDINPFNVGTGMSFLAKVLILCFLAKPGDVVIIENPEIHLHPKAQSRLGEFFSFLASKKIQLIIETHCEHLINSLRYQVYKKRISKDDIVIHYKEDENTHFKKIRISDDGYYINTDGKKIPFPNGFFDVSIQQLMEIGL